MPIPNFVLVAAQIGFIAELRRSVERSPSFYRRNQREWYDMAKQGLRS
jgi:hypothetical protein